MKIKGEGVQLFQVRAICVFRRGNMKWTVLLLFALGYLLAASSCDRIGKDSKTEGQKSKNHESNVQQTANEQDNIDKGQVGDNSSQNGQGQHAKRTDLDKRETSEGGAGGVVEEICGKGQGT